MNEQEFPQGSVPVAVAARVYGKDASWVRAGIISGWLPIGKATRSGKLVTTIEEMDSRYGRTVTYSDVNRVQLINKESPDIPFRNGFGTRLIDKMYPITLPYFPADKKFKIIVEEFLTDEKNGDFDTVGYLQLILPNGEVVDLNGYFKDGPDGMVRIEQAEYEERKANRIDKK